MVTVLACAAIPLLSKAGSASQGRARVTPSGDLAQNDDTGQSPRAATTRSTQVTRGRATRRGDALGAAIFAMQTVTWWALQHGVVRVRLGLLEMDNDKYYTARVSVFKSMKACASRRGSGFYTHGTPPFSTSFSIAELNAWSTTLAKPPIDFCVDYKRRSTKKISDLPHSERQASRSDLLL